VTLLSARLSLASVNRLVVFAVDLLKAEVEAIAIGQ
jgi:hypothetical protein